MKFIKENGADAGQLWVRLYHAGENALCEHFNAGIGADFGLPADAISHGFTQFFTQRVCHAFCGGSRGQAPGLEHQNFAGALSRL